MADADKNDTTPAKPKPAGTSGAVRPPVLEGTARPAAGSAPQLEEGKPKPAAPGPDASSGKPADKPAPKSDSTPRAATKPEPNERSAPSWLAGLIGGAIGLGAAYGLAFFGLWPAPSAPVPPADPRIAQSAAAIPELKSATARLQLELTALTQRLGSIETGMAALPDPGALAATNDLTTDLAALNARLDALAALVADSGAGAGAIAENATAIAALQGDLSGLRQSLETELIAITGRVDALDRSVTDDMEAGDGRARLPLVLSGLETAFASGRAYASELTALRQTMPDAAIPTAIANAAATGLVRPDEVVQRFNAAIPEMMAGRPISADGEWYETATDWFRGLVAMRSTGNVEGTGPDAVVARLETALAQRDFAAAKAEFDALPPSMRAAAGTIGTDIAALADAETFLAGLRSAALGQENGA